MKRPEMRLLLGVIVAALLVEAAGAATCTTPGAPYPHCSDPACGGSCNAGSGCQCSDITTPCLPDANSPCNIALFPNPPPSCCPQGLFWHPNVSCCSVELNCAPACNVDEICTNVTGYGECLCNKTYYHQLNLGDITPTVTCLPQPGQAYQVAHMAIPKCKLEKMHYDYTQWHPLDSSAECSGDYFDVNVGGVTQVVTEPLTLTGWCGNVMTVTSDTVTISNILYIPPDNLSGIIVSRPLNFSYSCTYNLTMQTSLSTALHPLLNTVALPLGNGQGSVNVTMAAYLSDSFTDPYSTETKLDVGTPLYIGLFTDFGDAGTFALRADRCVASPNNDAADPNAVVLIDGGCAVNQDVNTQVMSNGQSLEVRFSLDTFIFQNQLEVYMFCDVRMCQLSPNNNCSACSAPGTRAAAGQSSATVGITIPVEYTNAGAHTAVSWAVLGCSLLALLTLRLM